jgi:hypothetical protein
MMDKLTQRELKRVLHYSPWTGKFTWKISTRKICAGSLAGCINKDGYIVIRINTIQYPAHRLAHLYMRGYFPEYEMDHMKGIRADNRWKELRHVTRTCNSQNQKLRRINTSGFPGVSHNKKLDKWISRISINGKRPNLGLYNDPLEAALARFTAEINCPLWTCDNRSETAKAIKDVWPEFSFN